MVVDWLRDAPKVAHRSVDGTCVFADISGFTRLTERLAQRGRAGAEEMGDLMNGVFDHLLTAAYDYGANLVKWGGDAVLLLFNGPDHPARAAQGAWAMRVALASRGQLDTSAGPVSLGMSIGMHSGQFDFLLVGSRFRELIVTGTAATTTAHMEKLARRGQIVVSDETATALPGLVATVAGGAWRLTAPPAVGLAPNRIPKRGDVDLTRCFCEQLSEHLMSGVVEPEHRHAAVGFIEMSGTDPLLADRGPEELVEAVGWVIDSTQEAAAASDVTVLATDICENGAKIILTAGVPRSAGDDETRMLTAVKRVVHRGGRLELRAGITSGRVFSGDYGPRYRRTYSINGDIVNLAARLMSAAGPGQVLAAPEVVERSRTRFAASSLPPLQLKGKRQAYQAVVVGDMIRAAGNPVENRPPLVGREAELGTLVDAANRAAAGSGGTVELVGPPGMGKSRLVEELEARCGIRVLWAEGDIYATATPYHPLQLLFRRTLGLPSDVDDETLTSVLYDLVAGTTPGLLPWLPLMGLVLGLNLPLTPDIAVLEPISRKARLEVATSELLGRLLDEPLVFVFNDVHFMDDATLGLMKQMAHDATARPWLLVVIRRTDFDTPFSDLASVTSIEVGPLDPEASRQLVTSATERRPLAGHRTDQVATRSGGNPLYLIELSTQATLGADLDTLPASLEGVIAARIDRLLPAQRRWLRAAAVLGDSIDPELLRSLLDETGIAEPDRDGLDEMIGPGGDGNLRFAHPLLQTVAYEGLPYRKRSELHACATRILLRQRGSRSRHAALLSLHSLRGGRYRDAWRFSRQAGDRALSQYALPDAADCFDRALTAAGHLRDVADGDVADVYEALADVHSDLGNQDEADRALRLARGCSKTDPRRLARLHLKTAILRQKAGSYPHALRWLSLGRSLLNELDDPEAASLMAQMASTYALVRYRQGDFRQTVSWAQRALAESERSGRAQDRARALELQALALATAGRSWDYNDLRTALELYEQAGDLGAAAICYNHFGCAEYFAGHWDAASGLFAQAEATYTRIGREESAAVNAANRAEILIDQGRPDEAEPVLVATIRVCRAAGARSPLAFCLELQGRARLGRGDWEGAESLFEQARLLDQSMGEREEVFRLDLRSAECRLRSGGAVQALARLKAAVDRIGRPADATAGAAFYHLVRGQALMATGEHDAATRSCAWP